MACSLFRPHTDAGSFCVQESRAEELWQEGFCSSLPVELHGSTISQLEEDRREDKVCSDCKAQAAAEEDFGTSGWNLFLFR